MSGIVLPNGTPASSNTSDSKPEPVPVPERLWFITDANTGAMARAVFPSFDAAVRSCVQQQKEDFSRRLNIQEYARVCEHSEGEQEAGEQGE